jgi:tetratricopeptide (TPR) repeat protein
VDPAGINGILSVLERCDFARFAPGAQAQAEFSSVLQEAERAVSAIEQVRTAAPSRAVAGSVGALLLCVLASGISAQSESGSVTEAEALDLFRAGNAAFERSDYRGAIEQYRKIVDAGYESPDLLLNLGDAYYRAGRIGWAVHSFERGRRLDPNDPDLRANLELALRANRDRTDEPDESKFLSLLVRLQDRFPLNTSLWIASALWWVFALWMGARILGRVPRRADPLTVLLGALLLGALSWTAIQTIEHRMRPDAVVVVEDAPVRSNPDAAATVEFTLHGGTLLRLGRMAPGFREVLFSDELHGWTDEGNLAPL